MTDTPPDTRRARVGIPARTLDEAKAFYLAQAERGDWREVLSLLVVIAFENDLERGDGGTDAAATKRTGEG